MNISLNYLKYDKILLSQDDRWRESEAISFMSHTYGRNALHISKTECIQWWYVLYVRYIVLTATVSHGNVVYVYIYIYRWRVDCEFLLYLDRVRFNCLPPPCFIPILLPPPARHSLTFHSPLRPLCSSSLAVLAALKA